MLPFYLQQGIKNWKNLPAQKRDNIHFKIRLGLMAVLFVFYIIDIVQVEITSNNTRCVEAYGEGYEHRNINSQVARDSGVEVSEEKIQNEQQHGVCLRPSDGNVKTYNEPN